MHLSINQDLANSALLRTSGRQIHDRTYRSVVEPVLEADAPEGSIAIGDANPEAELITALAPSGTQNINIRSAWPSPNERRVDTDLGTVSDR